jgi:hypothetical protein
MSQFKLSGVSAVIGEAFERILSEIVSRLTLIELMQEELEGFGVRLEEAMQTNEFVDGDLALSLLAKSKSLLQVCKDNPREDCVPIVLAAVRYFLDEDDGQADFEGLDGFDDDKEVLDQVIQHFNLAI